uniref:SUMO-activating enzyme subunit 1 n=1 Tax=Anoplopoma fimbria TaxID=229290 RepID=C3KHA7_ANOFI|nr:SUMO-activating enzyme subunit 1 [Anoplopoma fimbria]
MIDMIEKEDPVISEEEAAQYDRQIRLWGLDAQKRLRGQNLNPMVEVHADQDRVEDKPDDFFLQFDAVSGNESSLETPKLWLNSSIQIC